MPGPRLLLMPQSATQSCPVQAPARRLLPGSRGKWGIGDDPALSRARVPAWVQLAQAAGQARRASGAGPLLFSANRTFRTEQHGFPPRGTGAPRQIRHGGREPNRHLRVWIVSNKAGVMNKDFWTSLAPPLARLPDRRAGYQEAATRAAEPMTGARLSHLSSTHLADQARLVAARQGRGFADPGPAPPLRLPEHAFGQFGTSVSGAADTLLPGLLEAEARVVADYGHVIATVPAEDAALRALLVTQRATVQSRTDMLRGLLARSETAIDFTPTFPRAAGARADLPELHP